MNKILITMCVCVCERERERENNIVVKRLYILTQIPWKIYSVEIIFTYLLR